MEVDRTRTVTTARRFAVALYSAMEYRQTVPNGRGGVIEVSLVGLAMKTTIWKRSLSGTASPIVYTFTAGDGVELRLGQYCLDV